MKYKIGFREERLVRSYFYHVANYPLVNSMKYSAARVDTVTYRIKSQLLGITRGSCNSHQSDRLLMFQ